MYPGFIHWWKQAQEQGRGGCGAHAGAGHCGPGGRTHGREQTQQPETWWAGEHDGGGSFGVRRPLRFMAHKLELDEAQVTELAAILSDLKTERAQAAVDHRRSVGGIADALAGEAFDEAAATQAVSSRVKSAEQLREAVLGALRRTHAMLKPEQRKQLAYLLRSGQLTI